MLAITAIEGPENSHVRTKNRHAIDNETDKLVRHG